MHKTTDIRKQKIQTLKDDKEYKKWQDCFLYIILL